MTKVFRIVKHFIHVKWLEWRYERLSMKAAKSVKALTHATLHPGEFDLDEIIELKFSNHIANQKAEMALAHLEAVEAWELDAPS